MDVLEISAAMRNSVQTEDATKNYDTCDFVQKYLDRISTERADVAEFHHVIPYADGGEMVASNLELRCRAHNQYEADLWSGAVRIRRPEKAGHSGARR